MESPTGGFRPHSGAERRKWYRLPITIPFFIHRGNSTDGEILGFAAALNLSASGVLLATKRYLEPSAPISLEVAGLAYKAQLPHSVSVLEATVTRCIPERHYFLLGLRFVKPLIAASSESEDDSSAANL